MKMISDNSRQRQFGSTHKAEKNGSGLRAEPGPLRFRPGPAQARDPSGPGPGGRARCTGLVVDRRPLIWLTSLSDAAGSW
jgi:hypothetical protein